FDKMNFKNQPRVRFHDIPWPILESPTKLHPEIVTWQAVEDFLTIMGKTMKRDDFKRYIDQTQKRFHLDRWHLR
ncbi:hypothetical protein LXA43DRAFT_858024, partial [Ganoderma leucocontextum]